MRRIVLGVTGSIAAYKAAELVRLFVKNGDDVHVVMTPAACEFVKPLTYQTLSRNPVLVDQYAVFLNRPVYDLDTDWMLGVRLILVTVCLDRDVVRSQRGLAV
jgi:phosphopantothenoylcysteine synthetase/decarboxylase